ncbi:MAG TPA: hypothetical protein VF600_08855 [Abditibacteriaceae bacterium]
MSERVLDERRGGVTGWLRQLDGLLRGEATRLSALRNGTIDISPDGLAIVIMVLGLIYGLCMGCYALFQAGGPSWPQMLSTMGKVPLLFGLTLLVTFPSLYVFNALVGSRLSLASMLRLIVAALAVMLAILASFGPIVAFFSMSTTSYHFMLLLNVIVFAVAGFLGLKFLLHTLHRLSIARNMPEEAKHSSSTGSSSTASVATHTAALQTAPAQSGLATNTASAGALDRLDEQVLGDEVKIVFRVWILVFGLVGAQMSWVLRPFLGHPGTEFALLRARESNFFEGVLSALSHLFG